MNDDRITVPGWRLALTSSGLVAVRRFACPACGVLVVIEGEGEAICGTCGARIEIRPPDNELERPRTFNEADAKPIPEADEDEGGEG